MFQNLFVLVETFASRLFFCSNFRKVEMIPPKFRAVRKKNILRNVYCKNKRNNNNITIVIGQYSCVMWFQKMSIASHAPLPHRWLMEIMRGEGLKYTSSQKFLLDQQCLHEEFFHRHNRYLCELFLPVMAKQNLKKVLSSEMLTRCLCFSTVCCHSKHMQQLDFQIFP